MAPNRDHPLLLWESNTRRISLYMLVTVVVGLHMVQANFMDNVLIFRSEGDRHSLIKMLSMKFACAV